MDVTLLEDILRIMNMIRKKSGWFTKDAPIFDRIEQAIKVPVTPLVAVDGIVEHHRKLIIIERKFEPLGLAWPGGFVDVGESCEDALHREMGEEINLKVNIIDRVGIYSGPDRDPRGHVVSICYLCESVAGSPIARDDAKRVKEVTLQEAMELPMVIDHKQMLMDAVNLAKFNRRRV